MADSTDEARPINERWPLRGLFDPDSFVLPYVDKKAITFLREVILGISELNFLCLVSFYRHPSYSSRQNAIVYRWVTWSEGYKLRGGALETLQPVSKHNRFVIGSGDFDPSKRPSLTAKFLEKFSQRLQSAQFEQVKRIRLELRQGSSGVSPHVHRAGDGLWEIPAPDKRDGFRPCLVDQQGKGSTDWSLYRPLEIDGRIAGMVSIDGVGNMPCLESENRKRLAAALDLFELSVEALYKKYYSQPEYGAPKIGKEVLRADPNLPDRWLSSDSDGVVYSSQFRAELLKTVLERSPAEIAVQEQEEVRQYVQAFRTGYLVGYFDANGIKELNDSLSHLVGNEAIRAVGRWLHDAFWTMPISRQQKSLVKGGKAVARAWVIRVAGDEFEVLLGFPQGRRHDSRVWRKVMSSQVARFMEQEEGSPSDPVARLLSVLISIRTALLLDKAIPQEPEKVLALFDPVRKLGVAGGYFVNYDKRGRACEKHDVAFKRAERAMYTAKSIMKDRRVKEESDELSRNLGQAVCVPRVVCLLEEHAENTLDTICECLPPPFPGRKARRTRIAAGTETEA